jgi:hypothetical protein
MLDPKRVRTLPTMAWLPVPEAFRAADDVDLWLLWRRLVKVWCVDQVRI